MNKLNPITDYNRFKRAFQDKFSSFLANNPHFGNFFYSMMVYGTSYVVGGYLRDISNHRDSRDMDIIVDLDNEILHRLLSESKLAYTINRMQGIKISLDNFNVDIWALDNNWAFKENVVKRNEDHIVDSIADGCFFNYDSLVMNLSKGQTLNVKNYNECVTTGTLDILRKNIEYKIKNPTIEANILRAFFLKTKFDLRFSENCNKYLKSKIGDLNNKFGDTVSHLQSHLIKYPKYQECIHEDLLSQMVKTFYKDDSGQSSFIFN